MMSLLSKFGANLRRLARDSRAVAVIEFAYAAPVFLVLVMVGLELSNLAMAYQRVNHMASTVSDSAARSPEGLNLADIHEFFAGAELIGRSFDFEKNGRVILSSIDHDYHNGLQGNQRIAWQYCWGDLDVGSAYGKRWAGRDDDRFADGIGAEGNKISARAGSSLIFVEVVYDYQPLVGEGWFTPPQIRAESAFNVRQRLVGFVSNVKGLHDPLCN